MEYLKIDRTTSKGRAAALFPLTSCNKLTPNLDQSLSYCHRKRRANAFSTKFFVYSLQSVDEVSDLFSRIGTTGRSTKVGPTGERTSFIDSTQRGFVIQERANRTRVQIQRISLATARFPALQCQVRFPQRKIGHLASEPKSATPARRAATSIDRSPGKLCINCPHPI
jgi:hypothetical protein